MIRDFERETLDAMNFPMKYKMTREKFVRDPAIAFSLKSAEAKDIMKDIEGYKFKNRGYNYFYDRKDGSWTFRLHFDIKYESVLTYSAHHKKGKCNCSTCLTYILVRQLTNHAKGQKQDLITSE